MAKYPSAKDKSCGHGSTYIRGCPGCRDWNRERARQIQRKWRESNPERVGEASRKYYAAAPEKFRERVRRWSAAHPEKVRENGRRRQVEHPEQTRATTRRRRAHKQAVDERFTPAEEAFVREFQHNACAICRKTDMPLAVDHWLPLSKGHPLAPGNAVLMCRPCNSHKSARLPVDIYPPEVVARIEDMLQLQAALGPGSQFWADAQ
jgi:5-methylcytosine-specific restriction endonuclease McrA